MDDAAAQFERILYSMIPPIPGAVWTWGGFASSRPAEAGRRVSDTIDARPAGHQAMPYTAGPSLPATW